MPDMLLELYSEEMPAALQQPAAEKLQKQIEAALAERGLKFEAAKPYWTPRRLTLDIRGLAAKAHDVHELRKGPAVNAPEAALSGFVRAAGLKALSEAEIIKDPKKGPYYVVKSVRKGRPAQEILAEILPDIIRNFSWPKSMRWGAASASAAALRWVRPLHSVLCVFSTDTESEIIDFSVGGLKSGNETYGHPFMYGRAPIKIRRFDDYAAKLDKAKVVLDAERRKNIILSDARNLCFARGLELVEDERLADEVAGLVEWPVVLMGEFDKAFLAMPAEIIRLTIRANQKCFVCRPMPQAETAAEQIERAEADAQEPQALQLNAQAALASCFVLTANIEARDNGAEIINGNNKVVRARLADALYFWKTDQKLLPDLDLLRDSAEKFGLDLRKPLDGRMARLDNLQVTFHAKLGTQGERVARIAALAAKIAPLAGAERKAARRAAHLAKADLQTEIVGEFPELQGLMGRKYAALQGETAEVAAAIEEHYKPQGPKDNVPRNPLSMAVALADKIDSLVGFWLIDEKPTGSKDPYALRRAALGVIRLALARDRQIPLMPLFREAAQLLYPSIVATYMQRFAAKAAHDKTGGESGGKTRLAEEEKRFEERLISGADAALRDLLSFIHERFKVYLREEGARYDAIEAVLDAETDNLLEAARKIEALIVFINKEEGAALLGGAKRALNILAAEEEKAAKQAEKAAGNAPRGASAGAGKASEAQGAAGGGVAAKAKGGRGAAFGAVPAQVDPVEFVMPQETALYDAVFRAEKQLKSLLEQGNFSGSLAALAELRSPIDAFFDAVLVNDENPALRANRLAVLARIRRLTALFADFSKLNG